MTRKNHCMSIAVVLCVALLAAALVHCDGPAGGQTKGDRLGSAEADDVVRHQEDESEEEHHESHGGASVSMTEAEAAELGIEVLAAAPGDIELTVVLPGEIVLNGDRLVHIVPRVGGIVREVRAHLGDGVKRGEIMAVIESRELADATADYLASRERLALARGVFDREESLWLKKISSEQEYLNARRDLTEAGIAKRAAEQKLLALGFSVDTLEIMPSRTASSLTRYELRAPIDGTVIEKRIRLGEALAEDVEVYVVADLDTVWVDINVYQKDLPLVRDGQPVSIIIDDGLPAVEGVVDYVGPVLGRETRTALARIVLPNPDGELRPGTFVRAAVSIDNTPVPVAVPKDAVQTLDGESVVFVWTGSAFEARPVTTGRSSAGSFEIVSGLDQGERYAAEGAFGLKARLVTGSLDSHAGHGH